MRNLPSRMKFKNKIVVACIGALAIFASPHVFAFPISGTCAMLVTQPVAYGQTIPATNGLNILATITFTGAATGTFNYVSVVAIYTTSGPVAQTAPAPSLTSGTFAVADGTIPGSKKVTLSTGQVVNMYAVNADKTILVQGFNHLSQGICQF